MDLELTPPACEDRSGTSDPADEANIRYSLTALGEAFVIERAGKRFRGFGPCSFASLAAARFAERAVRH